MRRNERDLNSDKQKQKAKEKDREKKKKFQTQEKNKECSRKGQYFKKGPLTLVNDFKSPAKATKTIRQEKRN